MNPLKLMPLLGLLCYWPGLSAQIQTNLGQGDTTCIFGDKVNVRRQPGPEAQVAFQLTAGEPVVILKVLEERHRVSEVDMPWYLIKTFDGRQGYAWGGIVSLWKIMQDGDVCFAAGVTGKSQYEVRAIQKGVILDRTANSFSVHDDVHAGVLQPGAGGLAGYRDLLIFEIGLEACGYLNYAWHILWNGHNFVSLPPCQYSADSGNYYTEDYLFPDDMKENSDPTRLYFQTDRGEEEYFDNDSGWVIETQTKVVLMQWDGKKYILPKDF
ncbi:MAG: SH3 domain-containing protein [Saprospiraceae bacterium]|nr:SH3 domain-containing protein [Saprospiraceae bacterium]